jgi:hypothetical protein
MVLRLYYYGVIAVIQWRYSGDTVIGSARDSGGTGGGLSQKKKLCKLIYQRRLEANAIIQSYRGSVIVEKGTMIRKGIDSGEEKNVSDSNMIIQCALH